MPYARLSKGLCKKLGNLYMGMKGSYNDVVMFTGGKVSKSTVIRLIQRFGGEAISFVDITGVIKWSKVIGVDEKYIKVPKSQKKKSKMRKYMYAYFAVDIYTYNLLHWNVYEYKDFNATKTFLLELKLKGYSHPRVIVTDLMGSYARAIKEVFGKNVIHHYCLFHGMQNVLKIIKKVYGNKDYKKCETAVNLKKLGYKILQSKTKRTADRRYKALFSLKDKAVKANPGIIRLFNFFKRNYPKFINGIESKIVPRTNNTTEFVISRFAQHYRNMRGFDSIDGARCYLNVFAVYYQFTPFTKDARGEIRGQCPLELAGYDISNISYQDCLMSMKLAA